MAGCNWILPSFDAFLREEGDMGECLLPEYHEGTHLVRLQDGRYAEWISEHCPDCQFLECDQDAEECFVWNYVSEERARVRLGK